MSGKLELRQLRAFMALARELHFARAGERLGVSQSSISQQIKSLEDEVGVKLVRRTTRAVKLTAAGAAFLEQIEEGLALLDSAPRIAALTAKGAAGELRIGFITAAIVDALPDALRHFREIYPDVSLHMKHLNSAQTIEAILNQSLDIGFIRSPVREAELYSQVIFREGMVAVMWHENPLAQREELTLADLKDEPLIQHHRYPEIPYQTKLFSACQQSGFLPNVIQETSDTTGIVGLVAAGVGSAVLPESVSNFARHPRIVFRRVIGLENLAEISAVCRQDETSARVRKFLRLLEEFNFPEHRSEATYGEADT